MIRGDLKSPASDTARAVLHYWQNLNIRLQVLQSYSIRCHFSALFCSAPQKNVPLKTDVLQLFRKTSIIKHKLTAASFKANVLLYI